MLLGVGADTARKQAAAGKFDPADLESVVAFWSSRQRKRISDLVDIHVTTQTVGVAREGFGCSLVAP